MDEVGGGSQISTSSDLANVFNKILAYLNTDATKLWTVEIKRKNVFMSTVHCVWAQKKVECIGVNGRELTRDNFCHQDAKNIMSNILVTWLYKHLVYDFTYEPHHLFPDSSKVWRVGGGGLNINFVLRAFINFFKSSSSVLMISIAGCLLLQWNWNLCLIRLGLGLGLYLYF